MKVEIISRSEKELEECDYRDSLTIKIDDIEVFSVCDDESEDSTLSRSFNDCFKIESLLEQAYNAGKNNEEFEILR